MALKLIQNIQLHCQYRLTQYPGLIAGEEFTLHHSHHLRNLIMT